jgi:hypothetical protein
MIRYINCPSFMHVTRVYGLIKYSFSYGDVVVKLVQYYNVRCINILFVYYTTQHSKLLTFIINWKKVQLECDIFYKQL